MKDIRYPLCWGLLGAVALAGLLGACAPTVNNHGHRLDPQLLAQIQPGVTSREAVMSLLGSPSSTATFDAGSWYYISQRSEQMSFYQREITAQDVTRVDFDANGLVTGVHQNGMDLAQAITPDPNKTRTLGNELTVLQQFVGNLGRFNSELDDARAGSAARRNAPGGGF